MSSMSSSGNSDGRNSPSVPGIASLSTPARKNAAVLAAAEYMRSPLPGKFCPVYDENSDDIIDVGFGPGFQIGDIILVKHVPDPGIVRYVGPTNISSKDWLGIEFPTPYGRSDGSIQGVTFFSCPKDHGVFRLASSDAITKTGKRRVSQQQYKNINMPTEAPPCPPKHETPPSQLVPSSMQISPAEVVDSFSVPPQHLFGSGENEGEFSKNVIELPANAPSEQDAGAQNEPQNTYENISNGIVTLSVPSHELYGSDDHVHDHVVDRVEPRTYEAHESPVICVEEGSNSEAKLMDSPIMNQVLTAPTLSLALNKHGFNSDRNPHCSPLLWMRLRLRTRKLLNRKHWP